VVIGLQRLTVLVGCPFSLSGDIKNIAQTDVAPDFSPARLAVAIECIAISIGRSLIVPLQEKYFGYAVVGQGTVLVFVQRFVKFSQCARQVSLLRQCLS